MKLLLTSAGIKNKSIAASLEKLVGKPFAETKVAFIPTAANVEEGDKDWLIENLIELQDLGCAEVDIVDFSAVPRDVWEPRLRSADVLYFSGGNTFHLMYCLRQSGLDELLPELLETRVFVGVSAGSMIASREMLATNSAKLYSDEIGEHKSALALGLVDFQMRPHLNSVYFPKYTEKYGEDLSQEFEDTLYVFDDQGALEVIDGEVKVISEGKWLVFND